MQKQREQLRGMKTRTNEQSRPKLSTHGQSTPTIDNDYDDYSHENSVDTFAPDYLLIDNDDAFARELQDGSTDDNSLGVLIQEPNFAINVSPEEFDIIAENFLYAIAKTNDGQQSGNNNDFFYEDDELDFSNQNNKTTPGTTRAGGTILLEPDFSFAANDNDGRKDIIPKDRRNLGIFSNSQENQQRDNDGEILEPDFTLDYDITLPDEKPSGKRFPSRKPSIKVQGVDIPEPNFGINSLPEVNLSAKRFPGRKPNIKDQGLNIPEPAFGINVSPEEFDQLERDFLNAIGRMNDGPTAEGEGVRVAIPEPDFSIEGFDDISSTSGTRKNNVSIRSGIIGMLCKV